MANWEIGGREIQFFPLRFLHLRPFSPYVKLLTKLEFIFIAWKQFAYWIPDGQITQGSGYH